MLVAVAGALAPGALAAPGEGASSPAGSSSPARPPSPAAAAAPARPQPGDTRAAVAAAFAAQHDVATRTLATVERKHADAELVRRQRVRAAYKLLRGGDPAWAERDARLAAARRRAGARWLLSMDRREAGLLGDEVALLAAAERRIASARDAVGALPIPAGLARPVRGVIARRFGPFVHDRSGATLTRQGVDFDVDASAPVAAVADGVVRYAGPIRGLDHGLVIDHGDVVSVLGKLDSLAVGQGGRVTRGQLLGRAARQRVYLELRLPLGPGGLPVDPLPLLEREPAPAGAPPAGAPR